MLVAPLRSVSVIWVKAKAVMRPLATPSYGGEGGFGEVPRGPQQVVARTNPNLDPAIAAVCGEVRKIDPNATMASVLKGTPLRLVEIILVDRNCVDFHSFGVCRRPDCRFDHDAGARPTPERVNNFLEKFKPVAAQFQGKRPSNKRRRG